MEEKIKYVSVQNIHQKRTIGRTAGNAHLNCMKDRHGECFGHETHVKVVQTIKLHEKPHGPKIKRLVVLLAFLVPVREDLLFLGSSLGPKLGTIISEQSET